MRLWPKSPLLSALAFSGLLFVAIAIILVIRMEVDRRRADEAELALIQDLLLVLVREGETEQKVKIVKELRKIPGSFAANLRVYAGISEYAGNAVDVDRKLTLTRAASAVAERVEYMGQLRSETDHVEQFGKVIGMLAEIDSTRALWREDRKTVSSADDIADLSGDVYVTLEGRLDRLLNAERPDWTIRRRMRVEGETLEQAVGVVVDAVLNGIPLTDVVDEPFE